MTRPAFTLIEVMISTVILALLSATMASLLFNLNTRGDSVLSLANANRTTTALFDAIQRDLETTHVATRTGEPGILGSETSLTIRSRAVVLNDPSPHRTRAISSYNFDTTTQTITASRAATPNTTPIPLGSGISALRFRYHDGTSWQPSFNSLDAAALPTAVEVTVLFQRLAPDPYDNQSQDPELPFNDLDAFAGAPDPFDAHLTTGRQRIITIPDPSLPSSSSLSPTPAQAPTP